MFTSFWEREILERERKHLKRETVETIFFLRNCVRCWTINILLTRCWTAPTATKETLLCFARWVKSCCHPDVWLQTKPRKLWVKSCCRPDASLQTKSRKNCEAELVVTQMHGCKQNLKDDETHLLWSSSMHRWKRNEKWAVKMDVTSRLNGISASKTHQSKNMFPL